MVFDGFSNGISRCQVAARKVAAALLLQKLGLQTSTHKDQATAMTQKMQGQMAQPRIREEIASDLGIESDATEDFLDVILGCKFHRHFRSHQRGFTFFFKCFFVSTLSWLFTIA